MAELQKFRGTGTALKPEGLKLDFTGIAFSKTQFRTLVRMKVEVRQGIQCVISADSFEVREIAPNPGELLTLPTRAFPTQEFLPRWQREERSVPHHNRKRVVNDPWWLRY